MMEQVGIFFFHVNLVKTAAFPPKANDFRARMSVTEYMTHSWISGVGSVVRRIETETGS